MQILDGLGDNPHLVSNIRSTVTELCLNPYALRENTPMRLCS